MDFVLLDLSGSVIGQSPRLVQLQHKAFICKKKLTKRCTYNNGLSNNKRKLYSRKKLNATHNFCSTGNKKTTLQHH